MESTNTASIDFSQPKEIEYGDTLWIMLESFQLLLKKPSHLFQLFFLFSLTQILSMAGLKSLLFSAVLYPTAWSLIHSFYQEVVKKEPLKKKFKPFFEKFPDTLILVCLLGVGFLALHFASDGIASGLPTIALVSFVSMIAISSYQYSTDLKKSFEITALFLRENFLQVIVAHFILSLPISIFTIVLALGGTFVSVESNPILAKWATLSLIFVYTALVQAVVQSAIPILLNRSYREVTSVTDGNEQEV